MLMFVCASPCDADAQESKCSLEFATRVGTVELGGAKRRGDGGAGAALKEVGLRACRRGRVLRVCMHEVGRIRLDAR